MAELIATWASLARERQGSEELNSSSDPQIIQAGDEDVPFLIAPLPLGGKLIEKENRKLVLATASW